METPPRIDALQYAAWSREVFLEMRAGGLDAAHATLAYHEAFAEAVRALTDWHRRFAEHGDLILHARGPADIDRARRTGRTAILLGSQTPAIIGADLGLLEVWRDLGLAAMQVTYNTQSLLGSGYTEAGDTGLTLMGREAVAEMTRLGIVVDLSHAGARTALETIGAADRPVAVTHANPREWRDTPRNVPDAVIAALAETGGMLGLSLYPHHMAGGSDCTLEAFCTMAARVAERHGAAVLGIGSDLVQGRPDATVAWMRDGRWRRPSAGPAPAFPPPVPWFRSNADFPGLAEGLRAAGFSGEETGTILGGNWARFLARSWGPA